MQKSLKVDEIVSCTTAFLAKNKVKKNFKMKMYSREIPLDNKYCLNFGNPPLMRLQPRLTRSS